MSFLFVKMPNYTYARSQGRNRFGGRRHSRYVTKGYLKAVIGTPESKFLDRNNTPFTIPSTMTTSNTFSLNNMITQGPSQYQRIGNEVSNKSLHVRLNLARAATVDSLVRVIIFWNIDGLDLGDSANTNLLALNTAGNAYISPLNKNYGKSFWVRYDRTYTLAAGQSQLVVDEIWRKLKCKTEWNIAEPPAITRNQLYITFISNQTVAGNQPTASFYARLNYMDVN